MDGEKISSQLPTYAESDGRGLASPGNAMAALMIAVIWFKFHTFDEAILPRHTLTLITGTGALGALLLLFMPALLLPRRARGAALVALDSLLSLLLLADLLYVRFYADLFSLRNIGLSSYAWEIASSIAGLARARDALYFADIPVFALLARFIRDKNGWGRLTPVRAASVCAVMLMGASGLAWKIYDYDGAVPGAIRSLWDRPSVATSTGTLVYHAADVLNIIDDAVSRKS
ncbi:MAG: hypothetical protein LBQ56_03165, partial [Synergistaceae bacterium]|nr:hypothetical protein [Synergistaceae bacterium]